MATYRKVDEDYLQLEIYGIVSGDQYVAVGFSMDDEMVEIYQFLFFCSHIQVH